MRTRAYVYLPVLFTLPHLMLLLYLLRLPRKAQGYCFLGRVKCECFVSAFNRQVWRIRKHFSELMEKYVNCVNNGCSSIVINSKNRIKFSPIVPESVWISITSPSVRSLGTWSKLTFINLFMIYAYRLKSGLDVYGAATSLIFSTMVAVINMHITFMMVKLADTMPFTKNSTGT